MLFSGNIGGTFGCLLHQNAPLPRHADRSRDNMADIQSSKLCECGCGEPAPLAKNTWRKFGRQKGVTALRFVRGHFKKKRVHAGYAQQNIAGVRKSLHVVIAEAALGRSLPKGAVVHHADGNKHNNHPSNLVICPSHRYHMLLHYRMAVKAAGGDPNRHLLCGGCKQPKEPSEFYVMGRTTSGRQSRCKACQAIQAKARPGRRPSEAA